MKLLSLLSRAGVSCLFLALAPYAKSAAPVWRWSNPTPHGNHINDMLVKDGLTIEVGEAGRIYSSADLVSWTQHDSHTTNSLRSITLLGNRFIIGAGNGTIIYGDSLDNLHAVQLGTTDWFEGVAASTNLAVAVGDNGAIWTSPDGASWSKISIAFPTWLRGVAYNSGRFYAVGEGGLILTSTNGTAWSSVSSPTTQDLNRVAWVRDRFYAVGGGGVILSLNVRLAWTLEASGGTNALYAIAGSTNALVAAGESRVFLKTDGNGWTNQVSNAALAYPAHDWTYYSALWDGSSFLVGGRSGFLLQGFRTNAASQFFWLPVEDPARSWIWAMARTPNFYAAVGHQGAIMTSREGVQWEEELIPSALTNGFLLGICGDTNLLVTCGYNGTILCSTNSYTNIVSTNASGTMTTNQVSLLGLDWKQATSVPATNDLQAVAQRGSRFVVAGNRGIILTSDNGLSWTSRNSGSAASLSGVAASPALFVVSGASGTILTSPDGTVWTAQKPGVTGWIYQVRFLGGKFVACGESGLILTSPDGSAWTKRPAVTSEWLNDVTLAGTNYFAVGDSGVVLQSSDLQSWAQVAIPTTKSLFAAASQNGQLIVAGVEGAILRAQIDPVTSPVEILKFERPSSQNYFLFGGVVDQSFQLESSSDLKLWQPVGTLSISEPDGALLYLQSSNSAPRDFFRTRLLP